MSKAERVSWVSLLITVFIGAMYFARVLRLPADADLHFPVLGQLATGPLTPLLVAQLLLAVLVLAGAVTYASRIVYYRRGV